MRFEFKGNVYTFRGDQLVKFVLATSVKGCILKANTLLLNVVYWAQACFCN